MATVSNNNSRTVITVTSQGPRGPQGEISRFENKTIHFSGSEYSGSNNLVSLIVTGSILPEGNGNWDLGSESNPFRDLYITTESLKFVSRGTGKVVSSLSAKDVDDLKQGKTITTQSKTLTGKDGATEAKTKFLEGSAFISSLDNDVYIKTSTNRMDLVAGGAGIGTINIGGPKQDLNVGPTSITGSLNLTGSLHVGHLMRSGNYAQVDFIASSSISNLTTASNLAGSLGVGEGIVSIFDNQFHHLNDLNTTLGSADDPNYAQRFYIGNRVLTMVSSLFGGDANAPMVEFMATSSGHIGVGILEPQATLHVSGNSYNWGSMHVVGNITQSVGKNSLGVKNVGDFSGSYNVISQHLQLNNGLMSSTFSNLGTTNLYGNTLLQGDLILTGTGNITASGNISASGFITGSNIYGTEIVGDVIIINEGDGGGMSIIGEPNQILFNTQSTVDNIPSGVQVTASGHFTFNPSNSSLDVTGAITSSGMVSTEPIYAPAFIETGTGTPTIESDSNLVLSASNAVVIADSPLRLSKFTNTNTGSGEYTFLAGDVYFNLTTNKFMGFDGSNHVVIGTQS